MFTIHPETSADAAAIEQLHDHAFGPGRWARTGFLLRGEHPHEISLSATAWQEGRLVGSIRFNTIDIRNPDGTAARGLLLGPLAVIRERQGNGLGLALVRHGLKAAEALCHGFVVLIGEPGYYAKAGFQPVAPGSLRAEAPLDQSRLCWYPLDEGMENCPSGTIKPV